MIMPIITMTIRTQLVHWLREHGLNLKLAVSAAWLYSLQPELLPDLPQVVIMMCFSFGLQDLVGRFSFCFAINSWLQEISKLSGILVNLLASYQLPSQDVLPFVRDTDKVGSWSFPRSLDWQPVRL